MNSQNLGVSLSSPTEPPMRRKRGRPRKDETVQGDNSPVTPVSDNLIKNKQSVETTIDPASDDMVGQMVSGVIEGSFDAGYFLNVKVGDTNTHLRGVVFLPGRFAPITAANDVAPHAKMYKRKEIPFPLVNPQGHLHDVSPSSGKTEHKNDTPKLPDRDIPIGLPPARNLPINDTSLPLGQKDMDDVVVDIGLQNGKVVGFEAFKTMKAGFEAFKTMKGPNINVDVPKASESVSATFVASLPVTETVTLKPQVGHQAVSSDSKPQELVGDVKWLDPVNDQTPKFPVPEPQPMPCEPTETNMSGEQASKFPGPEPQAIAREPVGMNMFGKQNCKFPEPEPQMMPCEPSGSSMFGKQAAKFPEPEPQEVPCEPAGINMFEKQASKVPEPEPHAVPCEPSGINMFGQQGAKFPEPEPQEVPCEPAGINIFGKQASNVPEPEPQAVPCEPSGINMFGQQASKFPEPQPQVIPCEPAVNMFGKQASKFPEPQLMPCEPVGINIFGKQASKSPEPEPQAMPCEPAGINMFLKHSSKLPEPEPEPQALPCEPTEINMFRKQASKFPEPEPLAIPYEPTRINMFGKQSSTFLESEPQAIPWEHTGINMFGKQASNFPEPEPQVFPCEPTGINIFGKQAFKFPEPEIQAIPCEPTGINMFGKQASSRQDIDISQDTQLELAKKIMNGTDMAHMDGLFASDAATTTVTAPCSASITSLPIMIFGAETIPTGQKPSTEEFVLPRMAVPDVSSSSMAINTNSVESNAEDAIPPAQS